MSWLFSRVLVEAYLGERCSDGEQSAPSNGNPIPQAYLSQDKMTKFSRLSRFGMTFKPLTDDLGVELLTLYLEDFHAKTSQLQEKEMDLTENGQECGKRWHGLLARYDQNTHLLRTVQCSLIEDLNESLQTWPRWGSMQNGECFQQPMSEQITNETGFGLLAETPSGNWPTPTVSDIYTANLKSTQQSEGSMHSVTLPQAVQKFPTPVARMWKDMNCPSEHRRDSLPLAAIAGGALNPTWTEWLMGWPLEWTDLKPLEMDKSHFVQQQPGTSLKEE